MNRHKFRKIIEKHFTEKDLGHIMQAYFFSKLGHWDQKRCSGEWYFGHPRGTAIIIMKKFTKYIPGLIEKYGTNLIIKGLFHDIYEDSKILDIGDIELAFGNENARGVGVLSKGKNETKNAYLIRFSQQADREEKIIKLADRWHNMDDLKGFAPKKRLRYADETKQYILPIAEEICPAIANKLDEICQRVYMESRHNYFQK